MIEIRHRETGRRLVALHGRTLRRAQLSGLDLRGTDLSRRNLTHAYLSGLSGKSLLLNGGEAAIMAPHGSTNP